MTVRGFLSMWVLLSVVAYALVMACVYIIAGAACLLVYAVRLPVWAVCAAMGRAVPWC